MQNSRALHFNTTIAGSGVGASRGAFGYQARFVCNSLMTLAALWTLATAASISSDDLSRRLRHRRAKSLVEMSMRFCGGLGLEDVSMFALQ